MTPEERIKLAELVGWRWVWTRAETHGYWITNKGIREGREAEIKYKHCGTPNPFTNANDDYACLQWMREVAKEYEQTDGSGPDPSWHFLRLLDVPQNQYQIGDYARAALKVLNNDT